MPSRLPATAKAPDPLSLDRQLCFALYSTSLAMTKRYRLLLDDLGLTYPQYLVMLSLWETDSVTVSALGERLHLDSGTLTPLLKRLEQAGLLGRHRDEADERRVRVTLTPGGRALRARALNIPTQLQHSLACDNAEVADLVRRLTDLRARLNRPGGTSA